MAAWSQHPAAGPWWEIAVQTLRERPPQRPDDVVAFWMQQSETRPRVRAQDAQAAARLAEAGLQNIGHYFFLPRLLDIVKDPDGYVQPVMQEVLLLTVGGQVCDNGD